MKSIVLTGASTGIGQAIAKRLTAKGFAVFAGMRKAEDGARLRAELGETLKPLLFDVTDAGAVAKAAGQVAAALGGTRLFGLVNNAGVAVPGALLLLTPDDLSRQLQINVVGQMIVTKAFAPLLGTEPGRSGPPGRIVMMSSVGGTSATPFMGAYNASKFALEGLSEALRRELMLFGIDVVVIAPGQVKTPIWGKAEAEDWSAYDGTPYARPLQKMLQWIRHGDESGLPPEVIGEGVYHALTAVRPKTRYVLTPAPLQHFLVNHLPKRLVDRIMAKMLGLTRQE